MRKEAISFIMSLCLSAHMESLGSQQTDFYDIYYLSMFQIPVEKLEFL